MKSPTNGAMAGTSCCCGKCFSQTHALRNQMNATSCFTEPILTTRLFAILLFLCPVTGCNTVENAANIRISSNSVIAIGVIGNSYYRLPATTELVEVRVGTSIPPGASLHSASDSTVDLCLFDQIRIRVAQNTTLIPNTDSKTEGNRTCSIVLRKGRILLQTTDCIEDNIDCVVETGGWVLVGLREPGEIEISASGETSVYRGRALWAKATPNTYPKTLSIKENQMLKAATGMPIDIPNASLKALTREFNNLRTSRCCSN